ncbi:MAG: hypothetical protein IH625_16280 [Rhodobacteraceae bacterium]|nr:hypothetical protein [Paracoccaceae bacterium]
MSDTLVAAFLSLGRFAVEAVLLVVIFRKAGFGWGWALMGVFPLLAVSAQSALIFHGVATPSEAVVLFAAFLLLPYLILAFKSWPVVAKHDLRPET